MEQFLIALALIFAFINGFHDSANSIATVVYTHALSPGRAVAWAAVFNFAAFVVFGVYIAETVGTGIIDVSIIDNNIILGALASAILWDLFTWYFGMPSSSSHALIGGLIGSAVIKAGWGSLMTSGIVPIAVFIVLSPLVGLLIGGALGILIFTVFRKTGPQKMESVFSRGQILSSALYSMGHGGNDAQKTIGVVALILLGNGTAAGELSFPFWSIVSCYAAIAAGTLFGGWRIVKTMGERLTKLRPVDGFCVETGAAITLFLTAILGIPVSTTQTITGSIVGIGLLRRISAVRWGVTGRVLLVWILTIPCVAGIAALIYLVLAKLTV